MSDSSSKTGGVSFFGLLTIVFITLKLLGKITWSWWWVIYPIPLAFAAGLGLFIAGFVVYVVWTVTRDWLADKRKAKREAARRK